MSDFFHLRPRAGWDDRFRPGGGDLHQARLDAGTGFFQSAGPLGLRGHGDAPFPHPDSPAARLRFLEWDTFDRLASVEAMLSECRQRLPGVIRRQTGLELQAALEGILPGLALVLTALAASALLGAAAGAAVGALGFGVGAVPGAAAGGEAGFTIGLAALDWLGLGFLVVYIAKGLKESAILAARAFSHAWNEGSGSRRPNLATMSAGSELAQAVAILVSAIVQGVAAFLLAKGVQAAASRVPELVAQLRRSRLGEGFAAWVETHWTEIIRRPEPRPRAEAYVPRSGAAETPSQIKRAREAGEAEEAEQARQGEPKPPAAMEKTQVPCFSASNLPAGSVPEFDRQLAGQQQGLNALTVQEYLRGRETYDIRDPQVAREARAEYQQKIEDSLSTSFQSQGIPPAEADLKAAEEASKTMKTLAALHNPDLVAGGKDVISDFGDKRVNSSLGAQWKSRVGCLDDAAGKIPLEQRSSVKMNAELRRCK